MTQSSYTLPAEAAILGRRALIAGAVLAGACAAGGLVDPAQFFRSWLAAWVFWLGLALGSLGVLMLQHLTGGTWGLLIRRPLEAATRTLPVLVVLFVPILLGLSRLYVWARPEAVAADPILQHKAPYLNVPFFVVRAAVYFAAWGAVAWALNRWSARQDETGERGLTRRLAMLSGPGLIVYVVAMTFASVDWMMSLEPHWFSTIYGFLVVAGQGLAALAFSVAVLFRLAERPPLAGVVTKDHSEDLGKLILAFTMVWAYFAFSQFLIIWAGNLPEEIPWYLKRLSGGWQVVGLAIVVLQFALPFFLLLSRPLKRNPARVAHVALMVVAMQMVVMHWMTAPAFRPGAAYAHWMDFAAFLGLGGVWLSFFLRELGRRPLLPVRDPEFAGSLEHARPSHP